MGSVYHVNKFFPNLANLCFPFKNLGLKGNKFKWTETHHIHVKQLESDIAAFTQAAQFEPKLKKSEKPDALRDNLRIVFEQQITDCFETDC